MKTSEINLHEVVTISLLGSDILNSRYCDIYNCALAKATKRHFDTTNVVAGSHSIDVDKSMFEIDTTDFNELIFIDLKNTLNESQSNEVVLTVKITCVYKGKY